MVVETREELTGFLESYVTMKKQTENEDRPEYSVRNVIDMDIIELKCNTKFGHLNLEICHYLKNRKNSDGMTVKFRFNEEVNVDVKSRVRSAIFRKDVSNYQEKTGNTTELVSLQIDTVKEFVEFFRSNIIDEDMPRKGVRQIIKNDLW